MLTWVPQSTSYGNMLYLIQDEAMATQPGQADPVTDAHTAQSGQANQTTPIQAHNILWHGQYSHSRCNVPPIPKSWTCLNVNRGH